MINNDKQIMKKEKIVVIDIFHTRFGMDWPYPISK